jgi:hypothetical protein
VLDWTIARFARDLRAAVQRRITGEALARRPGFPAGEPIKTRVVKYFEMASREKSWAIDEAVDRQDRIDRF